MTADGQPEVLFESVSGSDLLREIEEFVACYVYLPEGAALALAAWIMATYCFLVFDVFPYLGITSPVPRCGKSTLLSVIGMLSSNPIPAANISEAALFRTIAEDKPTLLLDEMEWLRQDSERGQIMRNLLNAGHRCDAVTIRCQKDGKRDKFSVYGPKAISAIGDLSETLTDRSIRIPLQRKMAGEAVERFRFAAVKSLAAPLKQRIAGWSKANQAAIAETYKTLPDLLFLDDRAADNWCSLFSVIAVADFGRLGNLRQAAESLSRDRAEASADNSLPLRLLTDAAAIADTFDGDVLPTKLIIGEVKKIEDSPWAEDEVKLTWRKVAKWFRSFGLPPTRNRTIRGYSREAIILAARRYASPVTDEPSHPSQTVTANSNKDLRVTDSDACDGLSVTAGAAHGDE